MDGVIDITELSIRLRGIDVYEPVAYEPVAPSAPPMAYLAAYLEADEHMAKERPKR